MRALRVLMLVVVVGVVGVLITGPSTRSALPDPLPVAGEVARPVAEIAPDLGVVLTSALSPAAAVVERFPALVPGTPCMATARACIDLSANKSWLISGGQVIYGPVPITHGRKGWRTPPGVFRVTFKNKNHRSSLFNNAPMPYSVFFNGGIAFHEGSLRELSHGCIHLSRAAAQTYFATLQRGDIVQVVP
ncbi:Lipoprotein-anchoring transpeptidase ErfK/SrfK [Pseudonocardia thermophila]|jgi:Uncharacterized protein conserved in bacteria|uniref:Lipoprotein-anchoring transpeptidase ErfK/SrfK n=1 Tax=Pseudonocardia thermophila TaxID=1848 RepID=A0A1M6WI53_PSETH|nr:L,D-transpeptidase [Pseudonocardia thermophila]SHK93319.1 Lipoprotein-anchoring transpeptidase ErfK/SrfK [Pseudonocardia thermophila]